MIGDIDWAVNHSTMDPLLVPGTFVLNKLFQVATFPIWFYSFIKPMHMPRRQSSEVLCFIARSLKLSSQKVHLDNFLLAFKKKENFAAF